MNLKHLALCGNCEEVFKVTSFCPCCGSDEWRPLVRYVKPLEVESKKEDDDKVKTFVLGCWAIDDR